MDAVAFIPLGGNCYAAKALDAAGLRAAALPFDWVIAEASAVSRCIDDAFLRFHAAPRELPRVGHRYSGSGDHPVVRIVDDYGFVYAHAYPHQRSGARMPSRSWRGHVNEVQGSFRRRIERFHEVLRAASVPVVFIPAPNQAGAPATPAALTGLLRALERAYGHERMTRTVLLVPMTPHDAAAAAPPDPRIAWILEEASAFAPFATGRTLSQSAWEEALRGAAARLGKNHSLLARPRATAASRASSLV